MTAGLQACVPSEGVVALTLCTPSHPRDTLPTAALLGAVLAMETECHWDRRWPLRIAAPLQHPLKLAEMQERRARGCCVACGTLMSLTLIRPSCLT